jgi:hypothetical protein
VYKGCVMDVKFLFAGSMDVQGEVYRIVQKKAPIHIPDSEDVDSVRNV